MIPNAYRVSNWNALYENNRTKEIKRLLWVPVPNAMDGAGYTELVDHPNGAAHFGAWIAILEIASRQPIRGEIPQASAGTSQALARISRLPAGLFDEVFPRLLTLKWIECIQQLDEKPHPPAEKSHPPAEKSHPPAGFPALNGTERNGIEENRTERRTLVKAQGESSVRPSQKTPNEDDKTRIHGMRSQLHAYMAMAGTGMERKVKPPDDVIVLQCLAAIGDASIADVGEALRRLFREQSPRHPNGPKSYAWFPAVLAESFEPKGVR